MKSVFILILGGILLAGCAGVAIESARITHDASIRKNNIEAALDETLTGLRLLRRIATALRGDDLTNTTVAYYWFKQAQLNGYVEAKSHLEALGSVDISQFTNPETTPCTIDEVLGDNKDE